MFSFSKKTRIHLLAWAFFITYEVLVAGVISEKFGKIGAYVIHYFFNIQLFYFHAHILLDYVLKKKYLTWALPLFVGLELFAYVVIIYGLDYIAADFPNISGIVKTPFDKMYISRATWRALYFMGFSTGYYFLVTFLKEKERTVALEKQRLHQIIEQQKMEQELGKAQNAYLRAQINPHFLFNTLNFIYNKTRKTAPVAADAILTLSAMMRYAVESSEDKGYILIEEEIEQVHNLIHLHRLRQNQQIFFDIEVHNQTRQLRVIPLILITLTENIFKHGNLSLAHHPASLKIYLANDTLFIETDNLINAIHNKSGLSKGLENIEKRLEHSYGNLASFSYTTDARNHFRTEVQIKLEVLSVFGLPLVTSDNTDK